MFMLEKFNKVFKELQRIEHSVDKLPLTKDEIDKYTECYLVMGRIKAKHHKALGSYKEAGETVN